MQYKNLFETNPKIIKCFFHFSQALQKKIANLKFNKKKTKKNNFIIAKNIEIICFLKPNLIKDYMTHLQNIFKNENKELALLNYIQKYWIDNRGISCFNYYDFINEFKINNNLNFLFITNNIIESFHQKMNMYLPRGKTTEKVLY